MNNRQNQDRIQDILCRRPLTPSEAAAAREATELAPAEMRQTYQEDQELSRLLERLPEASVPSNFTSRVLAALDRPGSRAGWWTAPHPAWMPSWSRIFGIAAAACLLLLVPVLWVQRPATPTDRWATSVATIAAPVRETGLATQLPPVDLLQDFSAIHQFGRWSALADEDLLASLE
jgi:hypothetical protein